VLPFPLISSAPVRFPPAGSDPVGTPQLPFSPPPCPSPLLPSDVGAGLAPPAAPAISHESPVTLFTTFYLSYLHTGTFPRRISFVCHSYKNCRGVYQQFPKWIHPSNLNKRTSDKDALPERALRVSPFASRTVWRDRRSRMGLRDEGSLLAVKPFVCHTCAKPPHNSFACHTSKITRLKVLCLPHIQHPPGGSPFLLRHRDNFRAALHRPGESELGRIELRHYKERGEEHSQEWLCYQRQDAGVGSGDHACGEERSLRFGGRNVLRPYKDR